MQDSFEAYDVPSKTKRDPYPPIVMERYKRMLPTGDWGENAVQLSFKLDYNDTEAENWLAEEIVEMHLQLLQILRIPVTPVFHLRPDQA
jgi:hypothetical protein